MHSWRDAFLAGAPAGEAFPLRHRLQPNQKPLRVLQVSDRGTGGLGGPTRADTVSAGARDFITFIRNVGEPRDKELGGGTYGFGKGIFYLLARQGSILVYTRCRNDAGRLESRLIGCTLWKSYVGVDAVDRQTRRYTGRHWWGDVTDDGVVEPLFDEDADSLAARLGLRVFDGDETGTTIVVIDPIIDDLRPAELGDYIAETMVWHLWPKMLAGQDGTPAMRFHVRSDGVDHPVPDPREFRPVNVFVDAYEAMNAAEGLTLSCQNPRRELGRFAVRKRIMPPVERRRAATVVDIEDSLHHVCLMRPAELVVKYHKGPKPPSENFGYAGVFRALDTMDEIYAKAEPPTHDEWHSKMLERPESTFVNTTFVRIGEQLNALFELDTGAGGSASDFSLGAASTAFASLLPGGWGTGGATVATTPNRIRTPSTSDHAPAPGEPGAEASKQPTRRGRSHARVQLVDTPALSTIDGNVVLIQRFKLTPVASAKVSAVLDVGLPGSAREKDPPAHASMPRVAFWRAPDDSRLHGDKVEITGGEDEWALVVFPAADTVTDISIVAEMIGGEG